MNMIKSSRSCTGRAQWFWAWGSETGLESPSKIPHFKKNKAVGVMKPGHVCGSGVVPFARRRQGVSYDCLPAARSAWSFIEV